MKAVNETLDVLQYVLAIWKTMVSRLLIEHEPRVIVVVKMERNAIMSFHNEPTNELTPTRRLRRRADARDRKVRSGQAGSCGTTPSRACWHFELLDSLLLLA